MSVAQKKIPIEARREIYELLSDQLQVKASDVTAILKKYGVTGDAERLQERYRRRLAQSLMSALRDEHADGLWMNINVDVTSHFDRVSVKMGYHGL